MACRFLALLALLGCFAGCASQHADARTLHYVDGELVSSHPVSPRGYEAYLRARLALESDPPQLEHAAAMIDIAIQLDPHEPHLWLTQAEVEERSGDIDAALASVKHALELRPKYAPAQRMLVRLGGEGVASAGVGQP